MPSIAIPVSLRGQLLSGARQTLTNILFSNNEPGFTFEPWDITTLFQDRAGTTPVTAAGQSVGYRRDKSQQTSWIDVTGAVWTKTAGDGVVSVVGDQITITGATTATQVTRTAGSVPFVAGQARATVRADYSAATGVSFWLRGSPVALSNGVATTVYGNLNNSSLDRFDVSSGTATLTIVGFSFWKGNHQVAVSDAKRGVYGWMPKTGRRNLLTYTEQFDNAVWTKDGATVTANAVTAPDGTLTADTVSTGTSTGEHRIYQTAGSSAVHTHTIYAKAGTANFVSLSTGNATYYAVFNLSTGAVSSSVSCTSSIVSVGDGWYRLTVTGSVAMPSFFFVVNVGETAASAVPAAGSTGTSKTVHLWGAQLEIGSSATAYQRVVSQYDITEAGVPTCYYVQADGVDDAYVTPTITPNTDKVQVFAGVRKLSDAAIGMVCEFSPNVNTNAGTFWMAAPIGAGAANYDFSSKGTTGQSKSRSGFAAPHSAVLTGLGDISADSVNLRVNGNDAGAFGGDQGTGNYLAYPAYIYGRAGTSLPFNGLDFGHAVRFGPNLDAATIARVESLIARNTPEVTL